MRGAENAVRRRELFEEAAAGFTGRYLSPRTPSPVHSPRPRGEPSSFARGRRLCRVARPYRTGTATPCGAGRALVRLAASTTPSRVERALVSPCGKPRVPSSSRATRSSRRRPEDARDFIARPDRPPWGDAQLVATAQLAPPACDRDEQHGKASDALSAARAADRPHYPSRPARRRGSCRSPDRRPPLLRALAYRRSSATKGPSSGARPGVAGLHATAPRACPRLAAREGDDGSILASFVLTSPRSPSRLAHPTARPRWRVASPPPRGTCALATARMLNAQNRARSVRPRSRRV